MRTLSRPWRAPCGCSATVILAMGEGPNPVSSSMTGIVACIRHARETDPIAASIRERQGTEEGTPNG